MKSYTHIYKNTCTYIHGDTAVDMVMVCACSILVLLGLFSGYIRSLLTLVRISLMRARRFTSTETRARVHTSRPQAYKHTLLLC